MRLHLLRFAAIAVGIPTALIGLSVPVLAEVARLTSLPLGKGTATITWTGKGGLHPTVTAVHGTARGLPISASAKVPNLIGSGTSSAGSNGSVPSIPTSVTAAVVTGTIDGAHFTFTEHLNLSSLGSPLNGGVALGTVTGSLRGEPIEATLTAKLTSSVVNFKGHIGSYTIQGVIGQVVHHGNRSTVHATFDLTK
jgi:hypothetical protein